MKSFYNMYIDILNRLQKPLLIFVKHIEHSLLYMFVFWAQFVHLLVRLPAFGLFDAKLYFSPKG